MALRVTKTLLISADGAAPAKDRATDDPTDFNDSKTDAHRIRANLQQNEAKWQSIGDDSKFVCERIGLKLHTLHEESDRKLRRNWTWGCHSLMQCHQLQNGSEFRTGGAYVSSIDAVQRLKRDILIGLQSLADGRLVRLSKPPDAVKDQPVFDELRMADDQLIAQGDSNSDRTPYLQWSIGIEVEAR